MRLAGRGLFRVSFLIIALVILLLCICSGFAEVVPPPAAEPDNKELKTPEPIEKSEEAKEEEKIRKFEQTQYELDEMGMTLEERKMRRVRPDKP